MRGPSYVALTFGFLLSGSSLAETARPRLIEGDVSLAYVLGPSARQCPDEEALRERAADGFGFRDPFVPDGAQASAHMRVEITRTADDFLATMFSVDDAGRGLSTSSERHVNCDALVWTLSHRMAIAILHAPLAAEEEPVAPRPAEAKRPEPRCDERCVAEISKRVPATSAPRFDLGPDVMAGALMTTGLGTGIGWGVWLGAAAHLRWLTLSFEGRAVLPQPASFADSTVATISGLFVPCARWRMISGCLLAEVGAYLLAAQGHPPSYVKVLFSLGPRASVDIPLGGGIAAHVFAELDLHPYQASVRAEAEPGAPGVNWDADTVTSTLGFAAAWSR